MFRSLTLALCVYVCVLAGRGLGAASSSSQPGLFFASLSRCVLLSLAVLLALLLSLLGCYVVVCCLLVVFTPVFVSPFS